MSPRVAPRWLDGRELGAHEPLPESDAPGVFETVRCERGTLAHVGEHLARLERGARALSLAWPPPWDPLGALRGLARALADEPSALRLAWQPPHLVLASRPIAPLLADPVAHLAAPGAVTLPRPFGVKTTRRGSYDAARAEALRSGAYETLVRADDGALVEGTITNVFVAVCGELATPPLASGALPGIVRAWVLTELERAPLVDESGRAWRALERRLDAGDLARASEVLLTNSIARVVGLSRLSGPAAGEGARLDLPGPSGPLARALLARVAAGERGPCEAR